MGNLQLATALTFEIH